MSIYEEAEQSYREDCHAYDSDKKWAERIEKRDEEIQANYLTDAKLGLI